MVKKVISHCDNKEARRYAYAAGLLLFRTCLTLRESKRQGLNYQL